MYVWFGLAGTRARAPLWSPSPAQSRNVKTYKRVQRKYTSLRRAGHYALAIGALPQGGPRGPGHENVTSVKLRSMHIQSNELLVCFADAEGSTALCARGRAAGSIRENQEA